jgi:hypothetical protein
MKTTNPYIIIGTRERLNETKGGRRGEIKKAKLRESFRQLSVN